ncbi:MAG: hypothetical protein WAW37_05990 [Syntrophobacteraceae bacterium]
MKKEQVVQGLQREISLPRILGMSYHFPLRAVPGILLGVSCWTAVVWLVWNHALTNLLNFGGIGPVLSLVLGTFLHAISKVLEDQDRPAE